VPVFTKQHGELLYTIWPEQAMPPGEYAVIEFQDGKGTVRVWDFGVGEPK
jgi:hypothetical protein